MDVEIRPEELFNTFSAFHYKTLLLFAVFLYLQRLYELNLSLRDHFGSLTTKKNKYFILSIGVFILLNACSGIKHLKKDEYLLSKQTIHAPKTILKEDLRELYAQETNRELFGLRNLHIHYLVGVYYSGLKHYDREAFIAKKEKVIQKYDAKIANTPETKTKKINNLQFKKQNAVNRLDKKIEEGNNKMQWGEPIAVLDTSKISLTTLRFKDYLFSKGYFLNKVTHRLDSGFRKHVDINYFIIPGKAYFIDTLYYDVADTAVASLIKRNADQSFLRRGERFDQNNFTRERERLDLLMKDNGYYDFSRQYIEFDVDTSYREGKQLAVRIAVRDPANRDSHKQFVLTKVNFVTDAAKTNQPGGRETRQYHGINYSFYKDDYNLRILSQRVFLQPGNVFSRTKTFDTQRQLANLDAFKFVNVNYDTAGGEFIASIYANPMDLYQVSTEVGVNVTQGYPGPFINMSFKKRNLFGGLEIFDLTGHFGFEGVASATSDQNIYKSTEAGINASITFPQILFPLSESRQYKLGRFNPKTRLQVGYSYTDRPEYRRSFVSFSGTYSFQSRRTTQYTFTFANISVIDTVNVSNSFKDFLEEQRVAGNYSLINSFYPSFVTSMIFGLTWNPNNYGNLEKNSLFVRGLFESGGTLWNFVEPTRIIEDSLQIFKYLRFNFDFRKNIVIDKNTVIAWRINSGLAYPYAANKAIPYEKFFFAGGSNSVRAWRPRRLGPGSYKPNLSEDPRGNGLFDYNLEKPAEVLIEGSIEVRKKLVGFLDGAVFLDVGNVWTINPWEKIVNDEVVENGNSQFKLDQFYKEFGVGTGFGFRFDFSFLILRFDIGMKVYDPARDQGDRFVLNRAKFFGPFGVDREPVIYNIGINYPF